MRVAVDLHIHSALSPCSDKDMTPNNIVNMAWLKGLDIIAVTDHNSSENLPAVLKCAEQRNILVVPGMEVETSEEVHLVCLFPGLDAVRKMQEVIYAALPERENREDIFGEQLIMDEEDNIVARCSRLLITAARLSIDDVFHLVDTLEGVVIPAHVDRESYSIISNLGMVPENLNIRTLEVSKHCDVDAYKQKNKHMGEFHFVKTSDAHHLSDILERESIINLEELSIECLIKTLKSGRF